MRITCPACQATYEVPDRLIPGNRLVRCARCQRQWEADVPPAPPPPPAPPVPEPEPAPPMPVAPVEEVPEPPPPPRQRDRHPIDPPLPRPDTPREEMGKGIKIAWAVSLLTVALLGAALFHFRADVVAAWPPAARLFIALGVDPAP